MDVDNLINCHIVSWRRFLQTGLESQATTTLLLHLHSMLLLASPSLIFMFYAAIFNFIIVFVNNIAEPYPYCFHHFNPFTTLSRYHHYFLSLPTHPLPPPFLKLPVSLTLLLGISSVYEVPSILSDWICNVHTKYYKKLMLVETFCSYVLYIPYFEFE